MTNHKQHRARITFKNEIGLPYKSINRIGNYLIVILKKSITIKIFN